MQSSSILKIKTVGSSETLVTLFWTTQHQHARRPQLWNDEVQNVWNNVSTDTPQLTSQLHSANIYITWLLCVMEFNTLLTKHAYLLTSWSRALLEMLTDSQLVKKLPTFFGTLRFITTFTNAHHLSLSRATSIQSMPPYPTSWRYFLILSSRLCLGLPIGIFPSGFPTKTLYTPLLSPICAACPAHLNLLDLITQTILCEEYRWLSFSLCNLYECLVCMI